MFELKTNPFVLSQFSEHNNPDVVIGLLFQDDGHLKPKYKFVLQVLRIDSTYSKEKIEIEYDTATRAASMAYQWHRYIKNKHLFPNLKYRCSDDSRFLSLNDVIIPVDSSFWDLYYPLNCYGCQDNVESTDDEITPIPEGCIMPDEGFRFNVGKLSLKQIV